MSNSSDDNSSSAPTAAMSGASSSSLAPSGQMTGEVFWFMVAQQMAKALMDEQTRRADDARNRVPLIIPTPSGYQIAKKIASRLQNKYLPSRGIDDADVWVPTEVTGFADTDCKAEIMRHIRGRDVFVVADLYSTETMLPPDWKEVKKKGGKYKIAMDQEQYFCGPKGRDGPQSEIVPDRAFLSVNWDVLLSTIDATVRTAKANTVTVVLPLFPSSRQDKPNGRESLDLKRRFRDLERYRVNHVVTIDIHNPASVLAPDEMQFDNLNMYRQIQDYLKAFGPDMSNAFFLTGDVGALTKNDPHADYFKASIGVMGKLRNFKEANSIKRQRPLFDPKELAGKDVITIDDMIDTAGTIRKTAEFAMQNGANSYTVIASHGVNSPPAMEIFQDMISRGLLRHLIMSDSVTHDYSIFGPASEQMRVLDDNREVKMAFFGDHVGIMDSSKYLAKCVDRLHYHGSLSELLKHEYE